MIVGPNHKSISASKGKCSLRCLNNGYCIHNPQTSSSTNLLDGELREVCICPKGYTGIDCLQKVDSMERCHETHRGLHYCLNGGRCRQVMKSGGIGFFTKKIDGDDANSGVDNDDIEWKCDCIEANGASSFAGDMCKRPHTEFCNAEGTAFCTNGGSCVNNIVIHEHSVQYEGSNGCICPLEFTGPHCEHLNEQYENYQATLQTEIVIQGPPPPKMNLIQHDTDTVSIIVTVALVVIVLGIAAYLRRKIDVRGDHEQLIDQVRREGGMVEFHHDDACSNQERFNDNGDEEDYVMTEVKLT